MNRSKVSPATAVELQAAIYHFELAGQVVCIHASLRSFGHVVGGAPTVVQTFLDAGCTLLVPTFSYAFAIAPPTTLQVTRNGWNYGQHYGPLAEKGEIYTPTTKEIDADMGAIPATVLKLPSYARGTHPLNSFSAVGPQATALIADQAPLDVYAPLRVLVEAKGFVLLMGVTLDSMTLLHHAEQVAGRVAFRRWANDPHGAPQVVEAGSCSDSFEQLAPVVQPWLRKTMVGKASGNYFLQHQHYMPQRRQFVKIPTSPTMAATIANGVAMSCWAGRFYRSKNMK